MIQDPQDFLDAIDPASFSANDILGKDKWVSFTPVFGSLTIVGATSYSGRLRLIGRKCEFQVKFSCATSIASVAGTDYLTLPIPCNSGSLSGVGVMTNDTTNIAVGLCHIDSATGRCYLPTQTASGNVFNLAGWYEI